MNIHCKYDELITRNELKSHPKNRNKHPPEQIARLAQILKYQGWRYPVKISKRSGYVTSGHGRIEAAWLNGWTKVPVNYQEYESEEQEYADVTADNAIASWSELDLSSINMDLADLGPDFDIDLLGIKDFVLEPADKGGLTDEDSVPEVNLETPRTKRGELYQLGEHRVLCGDSTDPACLARLMNNEKADMVFTDPPYGIGIVKVDGNVGGERIDGNGPSKKVSMLGFNKYRPIHGDDAPFDPEFLLELAPVQLIWGGNCFSSKLPDNPAWIVWDKKPDGNFDNDFSDAELAWTNIERRTVKTYRHFWAGMTRAGNRKDELYGRVHPTQKPVGLCAEILSDLNPKLVLDPFLGSGSTLIACEKTGRKCYGMEIDPHYIDVILERWAKFTGKQPIREDGVTWDALKQK